MSTRSRGGNISWVVGLGALAPVAIVAHAEVYLSEDQAAHLIFPDLKLTRHELTLSDEQAKKIETASGENVRNRRGVAYVGPGRETVFVDQVLGKHEFITFAVGMNADGSVKGVEILEYRETYGSQVRNPQWRSQFTGKTTKTPFKLGSEIKNISGATLSSAHVTAGVRRLLHTYDVVHGGL